MTKIIFLDVDGPMIPVRAYWLPNQTELVSAFDPVAVSLLNKLIAQSGAKIVMSASCRSKGLDFVRELLSKNSIDPVHLHDDWQTPRKLTSQRIHEIRWWLDNHPEITHYVAIDDEYLIPEWVPSSVKCCTYEGLSFLNYLQAEVFLDCHKDEEHKKDHLKVIEFLTKKHSRS